MALEEPKYPEILEESYVKSVPETQFIVEEDYGPRNPCSQCVIQWGIMPKGQVFGNRVVVSTADYKHVQKFKNEVNQREEALANWQKEQKERKERLEVFQEVIRSRRNSAVSIKETTTLPAKKEAEEEADGKNEDSQSLLQTTKASLETTTQVMASPEQPSTTTCAQCIILWKKKFLPQFSLSFTIRHDQTDFHSIFPNVLLHASNKSNWKM